VILSTYTVEKKNLKNSGLKGIRTHGPAMPVQCFYHFFFINNEHTNDQLSVGLIAQLVRELVKAAWQYFSVALSFVLCLVVQGGSNL